MRTTSRRALLLVLSAWLHLCVVFGLVCAADALKAPIGPLLAWALGLFSASEP